MRDEEAFFGVSFEVADQSEAAHDFATLTAKMKQAIFEAKASGFVFAGKGQDRRGRVMRHAASTLRALAARGMLALSVGPDGGMMGKLTEQGEASATLLASGNSLLESFAGKKI